MKTDKELSNILNECLERLLVKGESIEQCLHRYPEQAAELEPLLQTAVVAKRGAAIQPRAEFKARARYQFRSALQEATSRSRPSLSWLPRWAAVATIALVLLLVGGGTVVAAGNSMPDNPLYPVKLAAEQVQLVLTPSQMGKARLCAELADRRVAEIVYMANKGDVQQVELITQRLDKRLAMLAALASAQKAGGEPMMMAPPAEAEVGREGYAQGGNQAKLKKAVEDNAVKHQEVLQAVLEKAPEQAKPALRRAIDVSAAGYKKALEALD
jgi:hypothetical protein